MSSLSESQAERDGSMVTMTPTEYERHAGMAASKKWKYTVRVDDGSEDPQPVGAWLEARGLVRTSERCPPFRPPACVPSLLTCSMHSPMRLPATLQCCTREGVVAASQRMTACTTCRTIAAKRGGLDGAGPPKAPPLPTRPPSSRSANSQYRRGADGELFWLARRPHQRDSLMLSIRAPLQ